MLIYLGEGKRYYGIAPIRVHQRTIWEFQAVLAGEIGLQLEGHSPRFRRHRLWVFPPGHSHGWTGRGRTGAEVAVFHFAHVPEVLRRNLRECGFAEIPLRRQQGARLRELCRAARAYREQPGPALHLCHEHILLELSLLVLDHDRRAGTGDPAPLSEPIERSLRWFSDRMADDPGLDEVARASGVSPAHLRRLYHRIFRVSPKALFDQLRLQRAMHLMTGPALKLEDVALQCGFSGASAFSRAFQNKVGCRPSAWRAQMQGPVANAFTSGGNRT